MGDGGTNILRPMCDRSGYPLPARLDFYWYKVQKISPSINVGCLDGVEQQLSDANTFYVDEMGLEQGLRGFKAFSSYFNNPAIRKLQNGKETWLQLQRRL